MSANSDIKETLKRSGVRQWELAERYGLSESRFCVKLRKELPEEDKLKIFSLIQELAEEREVES